MRRFRRLSIALLALHAVACGDAPPMTTGDAGDAGTDGGDAGQVGTDGGDAGPVACEPPTSLPTTCNGLESNCEKRFDEVVYATTHNAFSSEEDGFRAPNQTHAIPRQLADGVRALMLDTYSEDGEVLLCHGFCSSFLGERPLVDALVEIREFLRCHPAEVVTIIFESYATSAEVAAAFEASGAIDYVHAQALEEPWPTLAEMIAADDRLVVFTDDGGGDHPWYHDVWAYARETPYAAAAPEELECEGGRGPADAGLLIFNHFLTEISGSPDLADMVNHDPFLSERIAGCEATLGQEVNFVTVDFYEIGDAIAAVAAQNGVTP